MNRQSSFVLAAIAVALAGCSMAPEYVRPDAPVPPDWPAAYQADHKQTDAPRAADLEWQEFFTDPNMQKIIAVALQENRNLRLAALNVERARSLYGIQRADLFPAVYGVGVASRQQASGDLTPSGQSRTSSLYTVNLGIAAWEIDFFGRIRNLEEQAMQEYLASEQARRGVQIALVGEIARVYMTIAADRASLDLARSTLETQQGVYNLVKRQYDAELAGEIDLRRAQTQVDAARGDIARFTQRVAQGQNALNLLAGSPVPQQFWPGSLADVSPPRGVSPGLSSEVLLLRPDIMSAEHQLKGAYAFIGAARAAFFPRIGLTTAVGTASDALSGLFSGDSGTWTFTPQATIPIFDPRTWAAHRVSKSVQDIALANYEKSIQTAFREVADALAVKGTIDEQVAAQQAVLASAQAIYDLSLKRYVSGIDSYLNVLDAQRSLYAAQQGLISLHLVALVNEVTLYSVLGGGAGNSPTAQAPADKNGPPSNGG